MVMNVTAHELARAQYKLLVMLEVSHAAKAVTNLTTIGFHLQILLFRVQKYRGNNNRHSKRTQYLHMYLSIVWSLQIGQKLQTKHIVPQNFCQLFANSRLFTKCCSVIIQTVNFTIRPGLLRKGTNFFQGTTYKIVFQVNAHARSNSDKAYNNVI